jgi:hypothetical protein
MSPLPPYTIARYGVFAAIAVAIATAWLANRAGYPFDQALMRSIFTFVLVTVVAFGAEAIILTSPPRPPQPPPSRPSADESSPPGE